MFFEISERIVDNFVNDGVINAEDKELYQYGIRQGFSVILNIVTTLLIGLIFNMVWQSALFLLSYIPIRSFAGGYHAKTPLRCYIFSIFIIIAVLLLIKSYEFTYLSCIILLIVSFFIISVLSPTEDKNKPLDDLEKKVYKKRTLVLLGIETVIAIMFILFGFFAEVVCVVMALGVLSIMLISGRIKNLLIIFHDM